jgi:hypothetical protein
MWLRFVYDIIRYYLYPDGDNFDHYPLYNNESTKILGNTITSMSCHSFAVGLLYILSGVCYDTIHIPVTQREINEDVIRYLTFIWDSNLKVGHNTCNAHHLIYCKGYVYQSYTAIDNYTYKYYGYPPIRTQLSQEDKLIFDAKNMEMDVKLFNRLCVPSHHSLSENTTIKCDVDFTVKLNPHRISASLCVSELWGFWGLWGLWTTFNWNNYQ